MPTDNPKVSAYVPQVLKDRLTQFRQERDVSESQAVTIILAEYFQMQQEIGRASDGASVGGVTLARMEVLEKQVSEIQSLVEQRFQELSDSIKNSKLDSSSQVDYNKPLPDKLLVDRRGDGVNEDLREDSSEVAVSEVITSEQDSSLDSELPIDSQENSIQDRPLLELQSKPLSEFLPISGVKLCKRLGKHNQFVKQTKRKYRDNPDGFSEQLQNEDPNGIAWKPEGKGYVPAGELTSEQESSLLKWFEENN